MDKKDQRSNAANKTFGVPSSLKFADKPNQSERKRKSKSKKQSSNTTENFLISTDAAASTSHEGTFFMKPHPLRHTQTSSSIISVTQVSNDPANKFNIFYERQFNPDLDQDKEPSKRQLLSFYLNSSSVGRRWDQLDALVNFIMASLYIYETSFVTSTSKTIPYKLLVLNAVLAFLLFLIFVPRYYISSNLKTYVTSVMSISSIVTILVPFMVLLSIYIDPSEYDTLLSSGSWSTLYPAMFLRLQYSFAKVLDSIKSIFNVKPVIQKALQAISTVITTVFAVTVLAHIVIYVQRTNKSEEVRDFGDIFFFTAVSSVTGLQSDVAPDTLFTRFIVLFIMFLGIIWLPPRMAEVLEMISARNPWPREYKKNPSKDHILVIGDLSFSSLFEFLREFFCEDHGPQIVSTVVVLMSEVQPSNEVAMLLNDPTYKNSVKFVLGSPTSFKDLALANTNHAKSIFVLSSKCAQGDEQKEDSQKIMITLAIKRFLYSINKNIPIYAQTLVPESVLHLEYLTKNVICIPELRLGLLAQGTATPGFPSLLQVLMTSIPDDTINQLLRSARRPSKPSYLEEYINNLGQEIYPTSFSQVFIGMKFSKAIQYIYINYNAILFALKVNVQSDYPSVNGATSGAKDNKIIMCPFNHVLDGTETGFIISTDSYIPISIKNIPSTRFSSKSVYSNEPNETTTLLQNTRPKNFAENIFKSALGESVMDSIVILNQDEPEPEPEPEHHVPESGASSKAKDAKPAVTTETPTIDTNVDAEAEADIKPETDINGLGVNDTMLKLKQPHSSGVNQTKNFTGSYDRSFGGLNNIEAVEQTIDSQTQPDITSVSVDNDSGNSANEAPKLKNQTLMLGSTELAGTPPPLVDSESMQSMNTAATSLNKSPNLSVLGPAATEQALSGELNPDGVPYNIRDHLIICSGDPSFPTNMEYLVGSIRTSHQGGHIYSKKTEQKTKAVENFEASQSSSSSSYWFKNYIGLSEKDQKTASSSQTKSEDQGKIYPNKQPIVFLSTGDVPDSTKKILDGFGSVYYVTGTPLVKSDLARCIITKSSGAIILLSPLEFVDNEKAYISAKTNISVASSDSSSLLAVLNIESLTCNSPNFFLSVELNYRENMQFIGNPSDLLVNEAYVQSFLRPCFMSGNCYAPIMLDTLICQAYYNDSLIELIENIIFPNGDIAHQVEYSKLAAAGYPVSQLPSTFDSAVVDRHIFMVPVPENFVGCTFSSLFLHFVFRYNSIPIGLYRKSSSVMYQTYLDNFKRQKSSENCGNDNDSDNDNDNDNDNAEALTENDFAEKSTNYFLVNPKSSTPLVSSDMIYVLSNSYPAQ